MEKGRFLNAEAWVLENETLRAVVLPAHGGKVASLFWKPASFECLFQNPKPTFTAAAAGDDFALYEACGFDDAFPTVDACQVKVGDRTVAYPDHGEIWSSAFQAQPEGERLHLRFTSPLLRYEYHKWLSLTENGLRCEYRIQNPTDEAIPALWTCHCLMRAEEGMRLIMPKGVREVENVFTGDWLGDQGRLLPYPQADGPRGPVDLSRMPPDGQLKYYMHGPVSEGLCGYRYPRSGVDVTLHYDPEKLPYLGFWATGGGFRGDRNCALEPTNGYFDSIPNAAARGACPVLAPGEAWEMSLRFELRRSDT